MLDKITCTLSNELNRFEELYTEHFTSTVKLANDVLHYTNFKRGKRLRPIVMFLVSAVFEKKNSIIMDYAIVIELLHNATLIHDDVVDESNERRNMPTINSKWNNKISVLIGDFLFALGVYPAIKNKDFDFLQDFYNTSKLMSEGELFAIELTSSLDYNEENYYKIIFAKTASLFSLACKTSAKLHTTDKKIINAFEEYGKNIGLAFQIKDDIFDYTTDSLTIGKPVGNDIREHKLTLPLIVALENTDEDTKKAIMETIKKDNISEEEISFIIDFAICNNGIDIATKKAKELVLQASAALDILPNSDAKQALIDFATYMFDREK